MLQLKLLVESIRKQEKIQDDMCQCYTRFTKKVNTMVFQNYKEIFLLNTSYKILSSIILIELNHTQVK